MQVLDRDTLLRIENAGWKSLCESKGAEFYSNILAADSVFVLMNGMVLDKEATVMSLEQSDPWASYSIKDPRVIQVNEKSAIIVYQTEARRDEVVVRMINSSVYAMVGDQIQLVLYQQTSLE
ncbi:nuclear transport factor 2 family protein [Fundicoccus culcitae]|uniref:Nuclear transport factor 2 family protein n=1 Tax=Fundicoccus culcitae TaxID=2969821 RepID=A0ABY5P917_9LACT|nr:nuclear transport factor 2 family protein [Fundicoccus culcitae]UUX35164.1 nuclear transport factor 2 family protein [Fundicoccus culcitae]